MLVRVQADYHAWLHCISDDLPATLEARKKPYEIAYAANASGTDARYFPKGSWHNPEQRNWRKVQCWTPAQ